MHIARASTIVEEAETTQEAVRSLIDAGYVTSESEAMFVIRVVERQIKLEDSP